LESAQVKRIRTIFEDRNIVGIGIFEKVTDKRRSGHLLRRKEGTEIQDQSRQVDTASHERTGPQGGLH
jgi:hypothetical protein